MALFWLQKKSDLAQQLLPKYVQKSVWEKVWWLPNLEKNDLNLNLKIIIIFCFKFVQSENWIGLIVDLN